MPQFICSDCGKILTDEERHYYGYRCEECEGLEFDRVEAWRHGAADPELDKMYDAPKRTVN